MTDADIRALRIDLAAALRWAARLELHEGIDNHFSAAVPGPGGRFLVNPWGLHWSEVTASSLVLCESDGTVLDGAYEVEATAKYIHGRIHKRLPHARCVLHTHMPYALALCTLEGGRLEMCEQNALRFHDRIAYDDTYNAVALSDEEGDRLASALGNRSVGFLASHGVLVVGPSIAEAFDDLYFLERACKAQVLARATGGRLRRLPAETVGLAHQQIMECRDSCQTHFAALKRMLDRDEPDYRN